MESLKYGNVNIRITARGQTRNVHNALARTQVIGEQREFHFTEEETRRKNELQRTTTYRQTFDEYRENERNTRKETEPNFTSRSHYQAARLMERQVSNISKR